MHEGVCLITGVGPDTGSALARRFEAALEPLFSESLPAAFPRALAHFERLCAHPAFAPDLAPYLEKLRG